MVIDLKLVKKDSQMIVGGTPEFEDCVIRLDYFVSAGRDEQNKDYCQVLFKGFASPLVVAEPFDDFVARLKALANQWNSGKDFLQSE